MIACTHTPGTCTGTCDGECDDRATTSSAVLYVCADCYGLSCDEDPNPTLEWLAMIEAGTHQLRNYPREGVVRHVRHQYEVMSQAQRPRPPPSAHPVGSGVTMSLIRKGRHDRRTY